MSQVKGLTAYYLATPLFAFLDLGAGVNIRAAALEGTGPRLAYYGVLVALGILCRLQPSFAPWAGMGESAFNLLLLMLAVLLPLWNAPDVILAGGGAPGQEMMLERSGNLLISGTVLVVAFHRHQARVLGGGPGGAR